MFLKEDCTFNDILEVTFKEPGGLTNGNVEKYEYECPCGKGEIIEEHDNIPGFREHDVYMHCDICNEKYKYEINLNSKKAGEELGMTVKDFMNSSQIENFIKILTNQHTKE
ncbi:MAG: hypothetical protein FWF46_08135 [Oscillospiraceae bacterium]|nr:hypothetical protein [Oscillospiraceae bacterium]